MTKAQEILEQVDKVIAQGPFSDNWKSLSNYKVPKWYEDAKFGIFIHWGVYSVPAFGGEWYARMMYQKDSKEYQHFTENYGNLKDVGYKDFIPMFKAENFNADEWMKLFKEAGARYVMPVAEHHDGFQMYDSQISKWNAKQMGPCRDVIGELKQAADKEDIIFTLSNHRAEHCWFLNGGLEFDSDVANPEYEDFYWKQQEGGNRITHDIHSVPPTKEHCEDWLARVCEMVELYKPRVVWFDWWIHNVGFKPYLKKFAAYYYNKAAEWGVEVAINYKYHAFPLGTAVFDIERGQLDAIRPIFWQTDTAVARNSWGYTHNNIFKSPLELVRDLVDIVSKNGCMLLNVGPKSDGTITDEDRDVLLAIGKWLQLNGEGIYDTTYWEVFGEGPTNISSGAFTDSSTLTYTAEDFRFTYKDSVVYAYAFQFPKDGKLTIKSLKQEYCGHGGGDFDILKVSVLGYDNPVTFTRDNDGLTIQVEGSIDTEYPVCFKVETD